MTRDPATQRFDGMLSAIAYTFAAVALGFALQQANGEITPRAMGALSLSIAFCVLGVVSPRLAISKRLGDHPVALVLFFGVAFQITVMVTSTPGVYQDIQEIGGWNPMYQSYVICAALAGAALSPLRWLRNIVVPAFLVTFFFLGSWMIAASPDPWIDVFVFQRDSIAAVRDGINPYTISFPNIYGEVAPFYSPDVADPERLHFGYIYPPLGLLLTLPAQVLCGDFRFAQLLAMIGAAAFMAYARPGRIGALVAFLFLLTPRSLYILEMSWTEPFIIFFLAGIVFCACRFPRGIPYFLGLLLATKQYTVFALPAVLLLLDPLTIREAWRVTWRAGLVALVAMLPFTITALPGFWESVVALQFHQPFRADSLSFPAHIALDGGPILAVWIAFAVMIPAALLGLWRAGRTPSGFAGTVALTLFLFVAFNKQAFCNYYYFALGAMCCAIAATQLEPKSD